MPDRKRARPASAGRRKKKAARPAAKSARARRMPDATLIVRDRTPQDDEFILQLTEEQWRTMPQPGAPAFPRDVFARYLQSGMPTRVVERGGKRIGYYSYVVGPDARLHVSAFMLEPTEQTDGVLQTVREHLEGEARRYGVRVMEVLIPADHARGTQLAERLGFREAVRMPQGLVVYQRAVPAATGDAGAAAAPMPGYEGPLP
ncbi:MAG: GNAT family N-acetyltransferase [Thermoflavifilum sp.]|nr:GNAT family N-acetyltransferase [Thermoflavifilum sp.]MCL6513889.1 GNAT family N-acetyltransferase [Alicyclobacillus sp.]